MASYGGRSYGTHGRLHKRAGSASSVQSPSLPPALEHLPLEYKSSGEFKRVKYTDEQWEIQAPKTRLNKTKPYLRKLSSKDDNKIDLSRTTEENEKISGLGIGDYYSSMPRSASDVEFQRVNGRARHGRATSNGSINSLQRPTAPYAHPMRQTPRPYTPPIAKSYSNSIMTADTAGDAIDSITIDDIRPRLYAESFHRTESAGSGPTHPPPLHFYSSNSLTRLNASQSSLHSSLPTGSRSRGATLQSVDTINSPGSSRPSMDKAVAFLHRGRSNEVEDEASRAASIRALRQAYNEKEEAKEAKYANKQAKKEERMRRKSDAAESMRKIKNNNNNNNAATDTNDEKRAGLIGKAYDSYTATHASSLPNITNEKRRSRGNTQTSGGSNNNKSPKSSWVRFLAWLRTRFLRWGGSRT